MIIAITVRPTGRYLTQTSGKTFPHTIYLTLQFPVLPVLFLTLEPTGAPNIHRRWDRPDNLRRNRCPSGADLIAYKPRGAANDSGNQDHQQQLPPIHSHTSTTLVMFLCSRTFIGGILHDGFPEVPLSLRRLYNASMDDTRPLEPMGKPCG